MKEKTRSYKDIWDDLGDISIGEKAKKILDDYNYCPKDDTRYDTVIQEKIKESKDITVDDRFMELINWVALWKTNRIIEITPEIQEGLNKIKEDDYIYDEKEVKKLIERMLNCKGIQIAMASTILHFFKPDLFPIIDKRAWRAINILFKNNEFSCDDDNNPPVCDKSVSRSISLKTKQYIDYRNDCEKLAEKLGIEMGRIDQFLYQIDKVSNASIDSIHIYETKKEKD